VELAEHFFRHESGRLVAALTRVFGVHRLALAEDVAQHAFCRALEVWRLRGVPENPSAWLLTTAKNRALDLLRRERTESVFAAELDRHFRSDAELASALEEAFSAGSIRDEQLRMMFSCCPPSVPAVTQLTLILNVLCGFGAAEISGALLVSRAAMEKRITRGKRALSSKGELFNLSDAEFEARLGTVRRALYLLFNEGYHGASATTAVRPELCEEAIRLTALLCEHPPSATPTTQALLSLMCLNAARLPARLSADGALLPWSEQDRSAWDTHLLAEGLRRFELSAAGQHVSPFHLEAAIAVSHASAVSHEQTNWAGIVALYDRLLHLAPSPVAALGRAMALAERDGPARGLSELCDLEGSERLVSSPFHAAALGELSLRLGDLTAASEHFRVALSRARNDVERSYLRQRLARSGH
jgi:RNA polymerase sigma-70 factor (ECF subfamily)